MFLSFLTRQVAIAIAILQAKNHVSLRRRCHVCDNFAHVSIFIFIFFLHFIGVFLHEFY